MIRILFVCHGSICRSPMGAYLLRDIAARKGWGEADIHIESAATSAEEIGNPVYPPIRKILESHGINCSGYKARRLKADEYWDWDYIIVFDEENMRETKKIWGSDLGHKIHFIKSYSGKEGYVEDPWYTRDFETCYQEIKEGCEKFLETIVRV